MERALFAKQAYEQFWPREIFERGRCNSKHTEH